jgi:DNA repair exonuclease SbcCD ATPase subunit
MATKKQLQEENEKLKKDLEFQTKQHYYYYAQYEGLGTMIEDAKDKQVIINRLKEENEKLKEEIVNIATIKNKQIKKEKDKYESMCSEQAESDCAKYINELKQENEELAGECERLNESVAFWEEKSLDRKERNKELKEENEKLKKEIEEFNKLKEQIDELFDATDYPVDIIGDGYSKVDAIYEWVHNRDEEIDELKKQIPKKPRKCFSYNDKARLSRVRDILGEFNADDKASDDPTEDDWYDDETLKLLDRLIK